MIRAGHQQPVLIAGGSAAALSDVLGDAAIGIGERRWLVQRVQLPRDWAILLYTDGLVEGRIGAGSDRLRQAGLHRLIAEWTGAQPDWRKRPDGLLDELIAGAERLDGGALSDDVAMLLLRAHRRDERG